MQSTVLDVGRWTKIYLSDTYYVLGHMGATARLKGRSWAIHRRLEPTKEAHI